VPRQKSQNPRSILVTVRLSGSERNELLRRAGGAQLSAWIRQRILGAAEPNSPIFSTVESGPPAQGTLEGGVPAPLLDERCSDYQLRIDMWAMQAPTDRLQRARLELTTIVGCQYRSTKL
jgi:hypothetical protein